MDPTLKSLKGQLTLVFVGLLFSMGALAQSSRPKPPPAFPAVVTGSEAYLLKKPSLEADILGVLPHGTKVLASRKIYGKDIKFRRVKVRGQLGYLTTSDLAPPAQADRQKKEQEEEVDWTKQATEPGFPSIFKNGIGLSLMLHQDRPHLVPNGRMDQWGVGLKLAGPDWFWKGPLADFQVSFAQPQSPQGDVQAFSVLMDYNLLFPFYLKEKFNFTVRFGPALIYNSVKSESMEIDLTRWDWGVSAAPTLSLALGEVRLDTGVKYHWTGAPFWSFLVSFEYMLQSNSMH